MSTKTLRKRIALVAVSALGFGLLGTASAFADEAANSKVTAMALVGDAGNSFATGTAAVFAVSATADGTFADDDDATFKFIVSSQPAGTAQLSIDATAGATTAAGATSTDACVISATDAVRAILAFACGANDGSSATMSALGTIAITPTVAGTYTITAWKDTNTDNAISANEATVATTVVFSVAGALTQIAISSTTTADRASTVSLSSAFNGARTGTPVTFTPQVKLTADADGGGITSGEFGVTLAYRLAKPATSASTLTSTSQTVNSAVVAVAGGVDTEGTAQSAANIEFTPDIAGTYTVTAWHDADADGLVDNGEASGSLSVAVTADAIALTVTAFNSTAAAGDWATDIRGALVRLSLTNGGVVSSLDPSEKIRVTVDSGQIELKSTATASTSELSLTTLDLVRDDFDAKGRVWLNFSGADATTQVITFDGIGGGVDSVLKTQSIAYKAAAGVVDSVAIATTQTTGVLQNTALAISGANGAYDTSATKATSLLLSVSYNAASAVGIRHIKDVSGLLTGLANAEYSGTITGAALAADSVTTTLPAFGGEATAVAGTSNYQFSISATLADDIGVVTLQAATDAAANSARDQNSVIRAKDGSAITLSLVIKDQFKVARANEAVAISIAGRNAHVTTSNQVSDASGRVSFTYTDAPLAGVTATQDVITFNQDNGTDVTYQVNFVAALGVSKVVAYGGNTSSTGVTAALPTFNDIKAGGGAVTGGEGVETGGVTLSAKVTDASGSVLVGVPVTWSIAGTGVEIATNGLTSYTNSSGIATTTVYGWIKGTYTYTATADGVASTGTISFAQTAAGEERTISATVSGSLVTAKVVDRIGNPVPLVTVYATKNGAGYFGNGLNKTSGTTDQNGEITFTIAGAGAEVTVATYDMSDATAKGSGQTCALAGNVDCSATAPIAFDATVQVQHLRDQLVLVHHLHQLVFLQLRQLL